jgi:hypothetical protein
MSIAVPEDKKNTSIVDVEQTGKGDELWAIRQLDDDTLAKLGYKSEFKREFSVSLWFCSMTMRRADRFSALRNHCFCILDYGSNCVCIFDTLLWINKWQASFSTSNALLPI